jgi:hypothetical protein
VFYDGRFSARVVNMTDGTQIVAAALGSCILKGAPALGGHNDSMAYALCNAVPYRLVAWSTDTGALEHDVSLAEHGGSWHGLTVLSCEAAGLRGCDSQHDDLVALATSTGTVALFNGTLDELWRAHLPCEAVGPPAPAWDGRLLFVTGECGIVVAVGVATGGVHWSRLVFRIILLLCLVFGFVFTLQIQ